MANALVGHRAVAAQQIETGAATAFEVKAGELLQIIDLDGKQIASLVAFSANGQERLSTTVTMTSNNSIVLKKNDKLYSQTRTPILEIVDDTVGRHDLLTSPLPEEKPGNGSSLNALNEAARAAGMELPDLTDPVHFFKHVVVKQRGELDVRDSLSERNDNVILRAMEDLKIVVANALPEKRAGIAVARSSTSKSGSLLVRVYR